MTKYIAIINQPGYLPEQEPVVFDNAYDAWDYIRGELEWEEYYAVQSDNDLSVFVTVRSQFDNVDKDRSGAIFVSSFVFAVEVAE